MILVAPAPRIKIFIRDEWAKKNNQKLMVARRELISVPRRVAAERGTFVAVMLLGSPNPSRAKLRAVRLKRQAIPTPRWLIRSLISPNSSRYPCWSDYHWD